MKNCILLCLANMLILIFPCFSFGGNYWVKTPVTANSIQAACQEAHNNIATGPHNVLIPNGTYRNLGTITINSAWDGKSDKKLTLRADTPGGVTFSGDNRFVIMANYWIFRGFKITGFDVNRGKSISITGDKVRITDNEFYDGGSQSNNPYAIRVEVTADNVEVDHNAFDNWAGRGIHTANAAADFPQNPHIHHNLFIDSPDYGARSSIFIGGVKDINSDNEINALIEHNIFNNCHGSAEVLLLKASNNTVRYNVMINSYEISLRHGDENLVFNNWVFGQAGYSSLFIQVAGANHKIINNYIQGTGGGPKCVYFMTSEDDVEPVENVLMKGNRFAYIRNGVVLRFGVDKIGVAPQVTLENNIFHSDGNRIANNYQPHTSITWVDNIVYTTGQYYKGTYAPAEGWPEKSSTKAYQLTPSNFSGLWKTWRTEYGSIYSTAEPSILPVAQAEVGPTWMNKENSDQIQAPTNLRIITQ
jgi:hypothetical protein